MRYVVTNSAPDGRHVSVFATLDKAFVHVVEIVGKANAPSKALCRPFYSDWGNHVVIEERPDDWTAALERRAGAAFDARECGTASAVQHALLDKIGW